MTVIEQAFELQKKHDLEELFERKFFEGCIKSGLITVSEIEEKEGRYNYLNKFFKINNSSIDLYHISESQSEEVTSDAELEERLSNIFKILSKKLIESVPLDELYKLN
ncbi:hypothetical protein [Vibrio harveyi]|uniref:hypothetical protein n=1 Tax=Vibrio harveyi TaxID=669 RepID=UPI0018F16F39|nr:hypothetical protein [Vibrio harveyi]